MVRSIGMALLPAGLLFSLAAASAAKPLPDELPPVNAFSAGIGFAAVAVPWNPATIYWNPAGLGVGELLAVDFTLAAPRLESPASWSFLVANSSSGDGSRFGLGIIRRSARRDTTDYKSFQLITPLSYRLLDGSLPVGLSPKVICESFDDGDWKCGAALDAGVMLCGPGGVIVGLATRNLAGSDLRGFRRESWLGCSLGGEESTLMAAGQIRLGKGLTFKRIERSFNAGGRLLLSPSLPELWAGRVHRDGETWITSGLGYRNRRHNTTIGCTAAFNTDDRDDRTYILTYSFGSPAGSSPRPGSAR